MNTQSTTQEWNSEGRVTVTETRNYLLRDPLLDWLDLYGEANGFTPDDAQPGYDERTDFSRFILEKGRAFEARVLEYLAGKEDLVVVAESSADIRNPEKAIETLGLMKQGTPIIAQAVLHDDMVGTCGAADLLVRSDVLACLFAPAIDESEASVPAPKIGAKNWHYRVVDTKFTTLEFQKTGRLSDGGSTPAYKAQLYIYNAALGRAQAFEPSCAYLLGRAWVEQFGRKARGNRADERLGAIAMEDTIAKRPVAQWVSEALDWVRRVRREGFQWEVSPKPSVLELRPNMKNTSDSPWHAAKREIASKQGELTLLWQVGVDKRNLAITAGIERWTDPRCTAAAAGVTGDKQRPMLQALLDVNQTTTGPAIRPARISAAEEQWRERQPVEFFVDFETVNDLDDDFSAFPQKGAQPLIFMIGCGYIEDGEWKFRCFTAERLDEECEGVILDQWWAHMGTVTQRLAPDLSSPRVFHWAQAETSALETAYNAAVVRHTNRDLPHPNWVDLLKLVIRAEPVVVRGALSFGLKAVAMAMHELGLIRTRWDEGPTDGLGAMVGACWCEREAAARNVPMRNLDLMKEIEEYNEVDCRVMMEILEYLRANH